MLLIENHSLVWVTFFIKIPVHAKTIYFLFDSVHLLKAVRNNWIYLKTHLKTFTFPDIEDNLVSM